MHRRQLFAATLAAAAAAPPRPTQAQTNFPTRPVRIIAPFAPGGIVDVYARLIAAQLSERWGQPVIVDNRVGAAGYIGTEQAARMPPDGYAIVFGSITTHALTPFLFRNPAYDPTTDFAPIALVMEAEGVAAVHPSVPVRSIPELIAYARAANPPLVIATGGVGTASHLAAEMFKRMTGLEQIEVNHYRSMAPMVNDLVAGHALVAFPTMQTAVPHVRSGGLRGLAVIGNARSTALPDLPTVAESGLPGFAVNNWFGFFAPARTPSGIVQQINAEILRIMARPDMQDRLPRDGARFWPMTPEEFASFVADQARIWGPIAQAANITLN